MEISNLLIGLVGVGSTILGFIISFLTFKRDNNKDLIEEVRKEAKKEANITTKLDSISNGVESMRVDFKVEQEARNKLSERVTRVEETTKRVEESTKQAHKRIDEMEKG